ncbi:hypothetical protein [Microbulbifer sp. GL-2]|uniref:hypothetical protein n=1 Tax=Microbulbifer sp. GL-2 TaxID=2591606 RepID=UPI00117BDFB2|nr:hypothetical protein [Microbulbifer sp. GL-2]
MKKIYLLFFVLLVIIFASLYGLNHYREIKRHQQEQSAHLLASCVNQGILSLFRLQANDWRKHPNYYLDQQRELNEKIAALPKKILEGPSFNSWEYALDICEKLTRNTNLQHITIFRPLGELASAEMSDSRTFKQKASLRKRKKIIGALKESAHAADRYLRDLHNDINIKLRAYRFPDEERELIWNQINSEVLEFYQKGNFSLKNSEVYLERVSGFYRLMAENPRGYTVRNGSLYFYDPKLRSEIENLNRAILQGEGEFFANYSQIVARKQIPVADY